MLSLDAGLLVKRDGISFYRGGGRLGVGSEDTQIFDHASQLERHQLSLQAQVFDSAQPSQIYDQTSSKRKRKQMAFQ